MEHVRLTMANYKINQERAHSGDYIYVYVCIYTYVYCVTCRWQQMAWSQLTQWPYHQASQQDGREHWTKKTLYFVKTQLRQLRQLRKLRQLRQLRHLRQLRQLRILKKASILTWHFLFLYRKDVSNELATSHNWRNPSFSRLLDLSFNPPGNFPQSHARAYFHISPLSRPSDNQSIQVSIYLTNSNIFSFCPQPGFNSLNTLLKRGGGLPLPLGGIFVAERSQQSIARWRTRRRKVKVRKEELVLILLPRTSGYWPRSTAGSKMAAPRRKL